MSTTTESNPQLNKNKATQFKPKARFSIADFLPKTVRETFVGPAKANWQVTGLYMAGAVACLGITATLMWWNRPAPIAEYGKVGEPFFAEFVDPTKALSLEVFTFDKDNVEPREFRVEQQEGGQWVIPSHHNYPADAAEQLANTASSVIGITRGAMVTRWSADHAKYGVVNPKQEALGVDEVDGVGQRLILHGANGSILADFIIGNQVDGSFDQYYVRHPDEDEVYMTKLNVDLSTKFTDWIDTELFDLNSSEIRAVTLNDYSFDELNGKITESEISQLSRNDSGDDWSLETLSEDNEELNKDSIRETINEVSNLKIAGVRPKHEGLTPDLMLDKSALKSQAGVDRLQSDLLSRGFLLQPAGENGKLKLIAREGELSAGTKDGLVYQLRFGRVFTGSQEELEIGFVSTGIQSNESESKSDSASEEDVDVENSEVKNPSIVDDFEDEENTGKPGRYVFVSVNFDKDLLGEEPEEPVKPTKPERLIELEKLAESDNENSAEEPEAEQERNEPAASDVNTDETALESEQVETESDSGNDETESEDMEKSELEKLRADFESMNATYEKDLKAFKEYKNRVEEGQQKAVELNRRFAKWYYVISGDSYDKLALDRSGLVKPKKSEAMEKELSDEDSTNPITSDELQNSAEELEQGMD